MSATDSFGQIVNHAADAVFHQNNIPVQNKADIEIGEFQIGQELSLMDGCNLLNCLVFDDDGIFHDHIGPETCINFDIPVLHRHGNFTFDNQTSSLEFVSQALLVDRFQKPGAQGFVNPNGAMDDLFGDLF